VALSRTQAVGQRIMPTDILSLQRDQPGDGVVPTLSTGSSVRRPTVTDLGERLLGLATSAISSLSFGVVEGVLAIGLATCRHALFSLTQRNGIAIPQGGALDATTWGAGPRWPANDPRGARHSVRRSRRNLVFGWPHAGTEP
jgi:hypothetical protein